MSEVLFCQCWHVTEETVLCLDHHRYFRAGIELASVTKIVGSILPTDWDRIRPEVLENARHRGQVVDALLSAYVIGELDEIPAGTRTDAEALFYKAQNWFDKQNFRDVQSQILLSGPDHAGTLDLRFDGMVVDLKCTSKVEETARLQVAAYADLATPWRPAQHPAAILHVTERYAEARLVPLVAQDYEDWRTALAAFRMVQRRKPSKDMD